MHGNELEYFSMRAFVLSWEVFVEMSGFLEFEDTEERYEIFFPCFLP
jgi:hypothetical protein